MERDLELNQNCFLCNNVVHEQKNPEKTVKKSHHKKNYNPTKVKSRNLLINISCNCLKNIDFDNASFIIDCYTYILFNLNPFFLERKFDEKTDREYVPTLWNYLIPNEFYVYICKNDNFLTLNKLTLEFQNTNEIVNSFILEDANNFLCRSRNVLRRMQYYFNTSILLYFENIFVE